MSVGQELLDVPFPEMIASMGRGIADAQNQLDMNSVEVAKVLAETEIEVVPAITRTIDSEGEVTYSSATPIDVSLLQAGLFPTFYQFSEAVIEVEMDIKTTTERDRHRRERRGARRIRTVGREHPDRREPQPEVRQGGPRNEQTEDHDGPGSGTALPLPRSRDDRPATARRQRG